MFSLSFLNSSALILALATIIPLLIYLFARKRPPKLIFSSIRFIQLSQKKQKKKVNITNILLLIIRMLIILFTVLAIARPAIKLASLRSKTQHPPTAIAVIIDNSYSMDYVVDTQTELDKALGKAEEIRQMLNGDDVSCLFTLESAWNNLNAGLNYGDFNVDLLRSIKITSQPAELKDVVLAAEKALMESHLPNREIYFITDMQAQELPEELETTVFIIPAAAISERNNLSVENARLANNFIERGIERQIEFEVVNHGSSAAADVICSLTLDSKTIAERVTNLEKGQRQWNRFQVPVERPGWHQGFVSVRDERLLYDNRFYFSFYYEQNPQVAVITSRKVLPTALKTVLEIYSGQEENIHLLSTDITLEKLTGYTNIIVWDYQNWDARISFILGKLSDEGSNILFLTNRTSDENYRSFMETEFSIKFQDLLATETSLKITAVNSFHPVAIRLAEERPAEIRDIWQIEGSGNSVLSAENNAVVLEKDGNLLWLFDASSLRSPFLVDANFPILAYNSLSYTASAGSGNRQFRTGALYRPQAQQLILTDGTKMTTGGRRINLKDTGIYLEGALQIPLAVNLDYTESSFSPMEKTERDRLVFCAADWQEVIFEARYGFELWKYLLIAVILLFLLEIWIIKREERNA
ncbi:MAG: VWA domain-containing protein [Candidatus Cloacimonetes bacterium]|nr:VWA domain-containing protein [Candidatus Cloacimonadota bacterium]